MFSDVETLFPSQLVSVINTEPAHCLRRVGKNFPAAVILPRKQSNKAKTKFLIILDTET